MVALSCHTITICNYYISRQMDCARDSLHPRKEKQRTWLHWGFHDTTLRSQIWSRRKIRLMANKAKWHTCECSMFIRGYFSVCVCMCVCVCVCVCVCGCDANMWRVRAPYTLTKQWRAGWVIGITFIVRPATLPHATLQLFIGGKSGKMKKNTVPKDYLRENTEYQQ